MFRCNIFGHNTRLRYHLFNSERDHPLYNHYLFLLKILKLERKLENKEKKLEIIVIEI